MPSSVPRPHTEDREIETSITTSDKATDNRATSDEEASSEAEKRKIAVPVMKAKRLSKKREKTYGTTIQSSSSTSLEIERPRRIRYSCK